MDEDDDTASGTNDTPPETRLNESDDRYRDALSPIMEMI